MRLINKQMRQARERAGVSYDAMADAMGISEFDVREIERCPASLLDLEDVLSFARAIDEVHETRRRRQAMTCPLSSDITKDYHADELQFLQAIDAYKRQNRRPHPTWAEVLEVIRSMG